MAVTDQQKLDFLLKKIGFTKTKTGNVSGTGDPGAGSPKQPFGEAIPSPLVVANSSLWNEADSIPATPPGSDTNQVKVYSVSSAIRLTEDITVSTASASRSWIAYSTYNNTSSARLTNWIDTQFGALYLIKVYKGDPNSGGVPLSAGATNNGWFFDYSAGVLNFNDSSCPVDTNDSIYIVGYRYIGQTGAPTSGISTFSFKDLTVERNLDVGPIGGISTFRNSINALDIIKGYKYLAAPYSGTTTTLTVTVASKVSGQHRYHGQGSGQGYVIDGLQSPFFTLTPGNTYRFDQSDGSNSNHQIKFYLESDKTTLYEEGVTYNGSAGNSGAYTQIVVSDKTPVVLHYQCVNHGYMGNAFQTNANVVNTNYEATIRSGLNVSGVSTFADDIVIADSIIHSGDTNTKIRFPTNDQISFENSGTESMRIFGYGQVLIADGVDRRSGKAELTISGSSDVVLDDNNPLYAQQNPCFLHLSNANTSSVDASETGILFANTFSGSGNIALYSKKTGNNASDLIFRFRNGTSTSAERVRITNAGNIIIGAGVSVVGVGTFSGLDISGDIDVDGHTNLDNVSIAGVTTMSGNLSLESTYPRIYLKDTNNNPDFSILNNDGNLGFYDDTNTAYRLQILGTGETKVYHNLIVDKDIDVDGHTNLDNISVAGVSTFTGDATFSGSVSIGGTLTYEDVTNVDSVGLLTARSGIRVTGGVIEAQAGENKIPSLYANMAALPNAGTYHGMFAHVHSTGKGYFSHAGGWYELVNKESDGRVGTGTETYNVGKVIGYKYLAAPYSGTTTTLTVTVASKVSGQHRYHGQGSSLGYVIDGLQSPFFTLTPGNTYRFDQSDNSNSNHQIKFYLESDKTTLYEDGVTYNGTAGNSGAYTQIVVSDKTPVVLHYQCINHGYMGNAFQTNANVVNTNHEATLRGGLNVSGVSTFSNFVDVNANIDVSGNSVLQGDLDVDGHTNLDNLSVAGVSTFAGITTVTGDTLFTKQFNVSGVSTFFDDVNIPVSNKKIIIGASQQLQIYNQGFHSRIDHVGGHWLALRGNAIALQDASNNYYFDGLASSGAARLYKSNSVKLATTNTGITVTGTVVADGADINGDLDVDGHTELDNVNITGVTTFPNTGKVLIGTATEGHTGADDLTIATTGTTGITIRSGDTSNGNIYFSDASSGDGEYRGYVSYNHSDDSLKLGTGAANRVIISDAGYVKIGTNVEGYAGAPNLTVADTGNCGITIRSGASNQGTIAFSDAESGAGEYDGFLQYSQVDRELKVGTASAVRFTVTSGGHVVPYADSTYDLGSSSKYWRNVYADNITGGGGGVIIGDDIITRNLQVNGISTHVGIATFNDATFHGDIDVDGHTNLDNVSVAGVTTTTGDINIDADNKILKIGEDQDLQLVHTGTYSNIYNATGDLDVSSNVIRLKNGNRSKTFAAFINGGQAEFYFDNSRKITTTTTGINVTGLTDTDTLLSSGNATFNGTITAGGATGTNGQYLKSTGVGVAWASFPTLRTKSTNTASAGQTTFSYNYTVGFLDVYVNGIKLSDAEFTATNGTSVVLSVGCFVGDIVELIGYNITSTGGGGGGGIQNIVEDTTPQLGGNLDLFNKTINGTGNINITGVVTATKFAGDGSLLTGVIASGTGIIIKNSGSTVGTAGTINFGDNLSVSALSGGAVTVSASAASTAEVRANTLSVVGVSTFTGNVDANGDLDVDGHTNLDNVSIAGVSTFTGNIEANDHIDLTAQGRHVFVGTDGNGSGGRLVLGVFSNNNTVRNTIATFEVGGDFRMQSDSARIVLGAGGDLNIKHDGTKSFIQNRTGNFEIYTNSSNELAFKAIPNGATELYHNNIKRLETSSVGVSIPQDLDVDGHTNLDNVSVAGVVTATTFKGALEATSASFSSNIDANGDLDVDGHTNLDNVSVAGVVTATTFVGALTGNAATATALQNARNIGGVSFDGTANINLPGVNAAGNQDTTGTAAVATNVTVSANNSGNETVYPVFVDGATGTQGAETDTGLNYNPSTGNLSATKFTGDGSGLTGITASGSGVVIKHDGSTVGTAGTINFGTNLDVSAISGGAVTITASGGSGSGISTISGVVNIANDLDVDGHTNLDNVSIAGVTTVTGSNINIEGGSASLSQLKINSTGRYRGIQLDENGTRKAHFQHDATDNKTIVGTAEGTMQFNSGDTPRVVLNSSGHWVPYVDGTYDLGINGTRWRNVYADTLYGDGSNLTGVNANVGITTNLSGSFTASAGSPSTINTFGYGSGDIVVEYTVFIKNGSNFQSQKLLAMRDGTTIHSTQFAVMFSSSLLVQLDATISSGNILLRATPETGVSGSTTYKVKREVM